MTIKLLPSKKVAPVWLPYIASGVYILAAAFTVYFYIHRMWLLMAICLPSVGKFRLTAVLLNHFRE